MKSRKLTIKLVAFFMALMMTILTLPIHIFASKMDDTTDSTETDTGSTQNDIAGVYVIKEDIALREENVKHFKLSDGTVKAVSYANPVHYLDENGNWIDIDNALTLSGNEYKTSNKTEIKFANKSGSNGLVSIKDGNYKIDFTPLSTNKVSVVIENPQSNNSRKFDDVKALNNLVSKATYQNIYNGIDFEYILVGNNIKENIIVKEKQDNYSYSQELMLNKLSATLDNGAIILSDYDTGEQIYKIPAPYMVDANGTYNMDVEYTLVQTSKWKYTLTVTANANWINNEATLPVKIDPTILSLENNVYDNYVDNGFLWNNSTETQMTVGIFMGYDSIGILRFNQIVQLASSQKLLDAKLTMFCNTIYDEYTESIDLNLTANGVNIANLENYNYSVYRDLINASQQKSTAKISSDGECEISITSIYKNALNTQQTKLDLCLELSVYIPETNTTINYSNAQKDAHIRIATTENTSNLKEPRLEITYVDIVGVEDYYGYLNNTLGDVGNSYVNMYDGSLTYINKLTTINSLYDISVVYHSLENEWKYSFEENIKQVNAEKYNSNSFNYDINIEYLWTDEDGTPHLFTPPYATKNYWGGYIYREKNSAGELVEVENPTIFCPDDDIDYVLKKTTNGEFILQDYNGNQKMFDSNGRLSKICDAQGNVLYFSYVNDRLVLIDYKTFDNDFVTQVRFIYDEDGKLISVYNFITKLEVTLVWGNNGLSKIEYNDIDGTENSTVDIYYVNNTNVIDRISDSTTLEHIKYTVNDKYKISTIQMYDNNVLQVKNIVQYNDENTIYTDLAADLILNTNDDVRKKYTFDEKGRKSSFSVGTGPGTYFALISTYEYDDEILPKDVYYIISYSSNINNELYVDESEANIVRYDIGVGEEEFLNFSNLSAASIDNTSIINEMINLNEDSILSPTAIIPPDLRDPIEDATIEPYRSICYLKLFYNGEDSAGTGFLIGPNLMLTAGHNVFNDLTNDGIRNPHFSERIEVYPGASANENEDDVISPYGPIVVETVYVQKNYRELSIAHSNDRFDYDWAICVLKDNIGYELGWFDISITSNTIINSQINVTGYPGDKNGNMYEAVGTVVEVDEYCFFYDADTLEGSSGSPVFVENDSTYTVKGIHTSAGSTANGATRINVLIYTLAMNLTTNEWKENVYEKASYNKFINFDVMFSVYIL